MESISLGLLALAVSLDSLTVGLVYGARGIKLPWTALLIVSLATGLLLSLAMGAGDLLARLMSPHVAARVGAWMLAGVGAWITYQTWRTHRRREQGAAPPIAPAVPSRRVLQFRLGTVGIVIEILREPAAADVDRSGIISPAEAVVLGIALALDSVAAGFGAAMAGYSPVALPIVAAAGSFVLLFAGSRGAMVLPFKLEGRWAMLHGLVLMLLGVYRMIV